MNTLKNYILIKDDFIMINFNNLNGKTLSQWDSLWKSVGTLSQKKFMLYKTIGLYKAILNNEVVYIGRAVEFSNGGLSKRLNDYVRNSNSGRKSAAGCKMHAYRGLLNIEILEIGDDENDVALVKLLERIYIYDLKPKWNID